MSNNTKKDHQSLLEAIHPIILEKGLKSTTMDLVAQRLQMSKRTLYEIFENKNDMILQALRHNEECRHQLMKCIMEESENVMVALIEILKMHREDMSRVNIDFFKDMDRLYPEIRKDHDARHDAFNSEVDSVFRKGVEQGVFRPNVNFSILIKMMQIQSESIKRMEEIFPKEISVLEVFDTMTEGFLRMIASRKGHDLLDSLHPKFLRDNASASAAAENK